MINLDHLNDEEREIIEAVILRDENERIREEQRVRKLKSELHQLRKKGAVKAGGEDSGDEKVCHRCRKELGFIFDSGEICPKCNNKVCNDCQVFTPSGKKWLCTVCDKQLQIKLGSPNWVGEKSDEVQSLPSLHGSQLVKVSLENSRATSAVTSVVDESEDTKRYYEDDLSYTDEESESYGSGEQDQNKSPERNVTFDSPLRQSAVPSDLGQGSQGDSKQMVFSNSSETLLHKHWHARSPGSGHRVFCTSVTPKSNVVLSYQHLNSSDEIYQKDVPSTSFIELPNFSIFRKVPVRQVKAQTQPFLRTSGPKASSGENGAISGSIHNTGILDDEIDNSSDLDSSEIEKVEELSDVDDTPVSVSTQTEPIDFCKGNIYLDGTVQEVDAPRAFMDYVVLDKVEKALVYYTEDVVNNHHPKKRKLSCDLVSDDEEVTALLRQSSASERGTVKIREWNFLPVLQSRERQKLVPSEPHLFVPVSRARPLTDSDPSSSTESSPVNLVECQSPSSSDCSLDLDEKLSANKRLVESLLQENTKIGNVATGEHVMKGGLVVEALMQKRFEGHSYVDTSSHINSSEHLSPDLSKVSPKKQLKAPNIDFTDFVEEEDLMESSDIWNGPDAVFMAYRTSQASSESDLSVIIEDPEEEKTTQKTVSEESEEEEEDEDVSRSTTEHHRDDFPVPYTQQYRTQKVEADVHSNEENGSYSPPAPKQKQIIDTTPNLKGDEWEQMLNGRLKDASEKEEGKEEQVTDLTSVKMEKKEQIIQQSEEQEDKVINNDKEAADEADEKGAVGDSVKETIEDEHEKVDKVKRDVSDCGTDGLKVEEDYDDAELVVINYSDGTNEGSESREVKPVLIKEEEEGKENADLKVEMADESCQSQRNDDHGTQTEGETVDVHVDVTDDMSHTMSVKSNTSQLEPYGMDGESHSISRRNTGGTLSKVNRDDFKKASRASLVSLYSNAEESYRLQVTGDVNFGTSYNYKTNTFQVKIVSCRDLVPVDTKRNRSNPYVKLYLLPDRSKHSKRKTHVSKSTINPVYSETLKYKIRQSELETRTLCVAVWHYDRFGHNLFLGEHLLSLDTVQFDDYSAKWHPLAQRQHRSTTALTYTGDVLVAIMYEPLSEDEEKDRTSRYHKGRKNKPPGRLVGGTLHVHIKEAKNLVGMKLGGSSSPICKCYLLPDKTKHGKKKTAVKRNTCNPKWTDILKFDNVTRDSLLERCLEVTVWDFDSVGSNSLMGGVRLGLGSGKSYGKAVDWMDSSGKEVSVWREMLKHPNHWVETTMTLRGDVGKAKK